MFDISTVFFASVTCGAFSGGSVTKERRKKLFWFLGKALCGYRPPKGNCRRMHIREQARYTRKEGGDIIDRFWEK